MKFLVCQKAIFILRIVFVFSSHFIFGQIENFGSKARIKPEPNYFFNAYGYADVVREYGLGFQYQPLPKYNFDVSVYLVSPNTFFKDKIRQWDYYDLKGYGISFKPKFQFSKLSRFYVGLNLAYEKLYHDKVWVEYYYGKGSSYIYHYLEDANGYGYTIGLTIGNKFRFKQLFVEPYFGLGITTSKLDKTKYEVDHRESYDKNFPYSYSEKKGFFQMNIGLKLGFSFKKSKKHEAIDRKFDELYIPKSNNLKTYFKSINPKDQPVKKDMRRAFARYEALNRNALQKYKRYYSDTTRLYKAVDFLFNRIDSLIIKGNK